MSLTHHSFIFYIFTCLITFSQGQGERLEDILKQKETLSWLKSVKSPQTEKSPYCKLCCIIITSDTLGKNCGSHTLCKYRPDAIGPACRGYIRIRFTQAEKLALLDAHNSLRNSVASGLVEPQPHAANMRAMQWSLELERMADRWAAQCIYNNDECRDLEKYPVGQNIAQGKFAVSNELTYVKTWFDEVKYFNHTEVYNFQLRKMTAHRARRYTQLVWADTFQLGCARAVFQENKNSSILYRENIICNYGPAGNIPNLAVYKVGVPCSDCPEGTSCGTQYDSLCEAGSVDKLEMVSEDTGDATDLSNAAVYIKGTALLSFTLYAFLIYCT